MQALGLQLMMIHLCCNVCMNAFGVQFVNEMMLHNGNCKYFDRRAIECVWSNRCFEKMYADSMSKGMLERVKKKQKFQFHNTLLNKTNSNTHVFPQCVSAYGVLNGHLNKIAFDMFRNDIDDHLCVFLENN